MTHEDKGHFSKKHPETREPRPDVTAAVKEKAVDGTLSCAAAHRIARDLDVPPEEVGFTMDFLEIRMVKCQMGLYGHSPEKRIVKPLETVPGNLESAIRAALVDGRLPCARAWDIARDLDLGKMTVSGACEALKIKISACQLGAF